MGSTTMERLALFNLESQPLWYTAWLSYLWGLCCSKSGAQLLKKERQLLGCFSSLTAKKTTIATIMFYFKEYVQSAPAWCHRQVVNHGNSFWWQPMHDIFQSPRALLFWPRNLHIAPWPKVFCLCNPARHLTPLKQEGWNRGAKSSYICS